MRHEQDRAFIEAELARPFAGRTVVVTHHAPHPGSIHPRYAADCQSALNFCRPNDNDAT